VIDIRDIDFNTDGNVNLKDFSHFASYWERNEPSVDIAPQPRDGIVDIRDAAALLDYWLEDLFVLARWRLDETEGNVAADDVGDNDGTLQGDPTWRPAGGRLAGALELDGIDDYLSTDFILDPADGPFSVYAWIKGGAPGQVVISQTNGTGYGWSWLCVDEEGGFMTHLRTRGARGFGPPLYSHVPITDGDWRRVGIVWDGAYRYLYVDGAEVGKDAVSASKLTEATGGLYFGAAKNLDPATHWLGLIDDIRIYNQVIAP